MAEVSYGAAVTADGEIVPLHPRTAMTGVSFTHLYLNLATVVHALEHTPVDFELWWNALRTRMAPSFTVHDTDGEPLGGFMADVLGLRPS